MLQDSYINEAYLAPIRSVLLVDERFLTVGDMCDALHKKREVDDPTLELERELELWNASRSRKWACDVVTDPDVKAEFLQGSDLIVLDYHLRGDDNADDSIRIVQQLSRSRRSNLVIVYTKESNLVGAKHRIAATLRGVRSIADQGLEAYIDDNEDGFRHAVSVEVVGKFLRGDLSYRKEAAIKEFVKGLELGTTNRYKSAEVIDGLLDSYIREQYKVAPVTLTNRIMMSSGEGPEWVQSGNVFVTLVRKMDHQGDDVFEQLEQALKDWKPPLLVASLAMARRLISEGGFALDSSFLERDPALHVGWLVHALTSDSPQAPPSRDSLRQLFARALSQTHDTVLDDLAEYASVMAAQGVGTPLMQRARALAHEPAKPDEKEEAVYLALNGYMCSEPSRGTHVTTGTVFKLDSVDSENLYWVCVTPACDMAPRPNKIKELGELRAMTVVRVRKVHERHDGLKKATEMNHLFVVDRASEYKDVLVFEINPLRIETMYAKRMAKLEESSFTVVWVRAEALKELFANDLTQAESSAAGTPPEHKISIEQRMVVVGQLREAYASRLMQVTGGHSSRIGIDFVNFEASKPK